MLERLVEEKKGEPLVFMLWGAKAASKVNSLKEIAGEYHNFLFAPHPSPFSAHKGFFGSKPFTKINQILIGCETEPIHWSLRPTNI
jgi:uracil-DNA glycosylase